VNLSNHRDGREGCDGYDNEEQENEARGNHVDDEDCKRQVLQTFIQGALLRSVKVFTDCRVTDLDLLKASSLRLKSLYLDIHHLVRRAFPIFHLLLAAIRRSTTCCSVRSSAPYVTSKRTVRTRLSSHFDVASRVNKFILVRPP
jgi:hypothetical protein